jgi:hypothetical protein
MRAYAIRPLYVANQISEQLFLVCFESNIHKNQIQKANDNSFQGNSFANIGKSISGFRG